MRKEKIKWAWASLFLTLFMLIPIATPVYAQRLPLIYVDPEKSSAYPGTEFTIDVNIKDVVDLYSWEVKLGFNGDLLEAIEVQEGPFLKEGAPEGTYFVAKIYRTYVHVAGLILGDYPGVSGSGTLFNVTFSVRDAGDSALHLYDTILLDSNLIEIAHDTKDGYFATPHRAELVRRGAWPAYRHFSLSTHGENQTLYGKVANLGPENLYVYVSFELVRDDGVEFVLTTETVIIVPDEIIDLTTIFGPLDETYIGKYYVTARAFYSWTGWYYWAPGKSVKTFSFSVVA